MVQFGPPAAPAPAQGCGAGAAGAGTFCLEPEPLERFARSRSRNRSHKKRGGSGSERDVKLVKNSKREMKAFSFISTSIALNGPYDQDSGLRSRWVFR